MTRFVCCSFHKVEWGGGTDGDFASGVIVGGCDNGHIPVYNAAKLLKGEDGTIALLDKHTGPVRALAFNKFQVATCVSN
jgi:protein transport protein SEC31